jgi:hypothetical protein
MTRAEAAKLFSRLPVEKAKIKELFDFNVGYSRSSSSKVSTAPKFLWLQLDPGILKMMLSKTVTLKVAVDDPQGADDISYVKADLSRLGGPPNAAMYDDGTNGDEKANDNIYSLSFETNFQNVGTWTIWVTVFDKSGLSETQAVKLEVNE